MAKDDDPNAPYRLFDGDERIGAYLTRAEARRAQQKLESEAGSALVMLNVAWPRRSWACLSDS